MDSFEIHANELHFGPWEVGTLSAAIPATVRDRVESFINMMDGEKMFSKAECDECYDKGYSDARADYLDEIRELTKRIAALEKELALCDET